MMLIAFMVLAVPLVLSATQLSDQLVRASMVYNTRLVAGYAADSGVELALAKLADPTFRDSLIPGESVDLPPLVINGHEVDVSIELSVFSPGGDAIEGGDADIVLVLDNSGSVSNEMPDLILAANTLVDAFDPQGSEGRIRMGVVRFANNADSVVEMTDVDVHGFSEPLHDGINGLTSGGSTNIVGALEVGSAQFANGIGDRPEAPNLMMVITDGNDTIEREGEAEEDLGALPLIRAAAESSGAEVFAIGVGSNVSFETLDAIAYDPDSPLDDTGHVFSVNDFAALLTIIDELVAAVEASAAVYFIESVPADATAIRAFISITPDGTIEILSYQVI